MNIRAIWRRLMARIAAMYANDADAELREELEAHLEMHIADNMRRGMSAEDARRDALLAAGGLTAAAESARDQRRIPFFDSMAADIRYAMRGMRARPGFAIAIVLTLAIAIGANTAIFSVVDAVVLHPLPYKDANRILSVSESVDGVDQRVLDEHNYAAWTNSARSVTLAAAGYIRDVLWLKSGPEQITGARVGASYFAILGLQPRLGRAMVNDDFRDGEPNVVTLSDQLWRHSFGADPAVIGRTIRIGDKTATIIGVMPPHATTHGDAQFWMPFRQGPPRPGVTHYWDAIARLNTGATIEQARAELSARMLPAGVATPGRKGTLAPVVMTLVERRFGDQRKPVLLLFAAVAVLLLIACANLANLALVRAAGRQREFAVRLALGAGRRRLARLLLAESLMLGLIGGILGVILARELLAYFVHLSPTSVGNPDGVHLNALVVSFTAAIAVASSLAFSVAPIIAAGRGDVARALSSGTPCASAGARQKAFRRTLVVAQLATALVLLTGAAIVARSFYHVASIDLGFRPGGLIAVPINLPPSRYSDARASAFDEELAARVRGLPHVISAAFGFPPLGGWSASYTARDSKGEEAGPFDEIVVGHGYFETIGARMLAGRGFTAADNPHSPLVVVVNRAMARQLFPNRDAVGQTMLGPRGPSTIVGVVDNVRSQVEAQPTPVVYADVEQDALGGFEFLVVRTSGDEAATEQAIGRLIRATDPLMPPPDISALKKKVAQAVAPRQFVFVLLAMFAGIAATLAVVGLYGLIARIVVERTREIGIRIALGAPGRGVIVTVLSEGLVLVTLGGLLGFGGSLAAARAMRALVYETSVYDPLAFATATGLLIAVAVLAAYVPARRATRIDPLAALRAD